MPTTSLPVNKITSAGIAPVAEAAADLVNGNHLAVNDGRSVWLEVTNTDGSNSRTLTVVTSATLAGRAVADDTYTLATTEKRRIGPFPVEVYGPQPVLQASGAGLTYAAYMI